MRIALIAAEEALELGDGEPISVGGQPIVNHQLEFALGLGCEKVVYLGHGALPEGVALRRAAERAGADFQVVRGSRDIPATVRGDDELLVFARGLLPDSPRAREMLGKGPVVLALDAQPGAAAGFELLDMTSAWGGAMLLPARLAGRLDMLPEDSEPIAGLLRIARQAGIPERPLAQGEVDEARWGFVHDTARARAVEPGWLNRRLPPVSPWHPSAWLVRFVLRRAGAQVAYSAHARWAAWGAGTLGLAGSIAAAWFGYAVPAFLLLALAALAIEASASLGVMRRPSFAGKSRASAVRGAVRLALDGAIAVVGTLVLPGAFHRRAFLAIVTAGLLRVPLPAGSGSWRTLADDRALVLILFALAAAWDVTERAFMLVALLLLVLRMIAPRQDRS